ncbi:MAG: hypothetical protein FJ253_00140, partial [Phycisphaerae bacterium]|nr:hypothetical protein [Phycisphaerae bacterium]
ILLGASIVFLLVLESQVSVLRAGLAGSIAGAALLAGRSWPASSILAVVAIVVTAVDPADARDAAFQLSFGAVAALLEVAPTLSARLERLCDRAHWWSVRRRPDLVRRGIVHPEGLRRVALTRMAVRPIAASLAAWIVVTPITLHHFGQCAPWAIPASVVLAPLASAIALVGTLAAVVAAWSIEVAAPLGWLLAMLGSVFLAAVEGVATLPGATALLPRPPAWWSLVAIALPFLIVSASKRNRRAAMALAGAWIVVALMPLLPSAGREPQIVVLDLGRARCSLVIAGRSALLVDAGDSGRSMGVGAPGSSAARSILRAAVELGVTRFDAVVVTEHSLESMGAVPDLLELASIDRLLVVESMLDSPASMVPGRMLAIAAARGVPVEPISPASSVRAGDGGASLELRFRRDDAAPPDRRLVVTAGEPSSPHGFGASTPAFESLPEHPPVPMSALRAMHDGIARHAPPRGARRWRLDPAFGWISDRFDRDRWRPSSTSE